MAFGDGNGSLTLGTGGILELKGASAIANTGGQLNFAGGTLRAAGDLTVEHWANLMTDGVIFDMNGYELTYTGALQGDGGIRIVGQGLVTLGGANDFGGGIVIESGSLTAARADGFGTGQITLDGGELILPSMGTFSNGVHAGENGGTINLGGEEFAIYIDGTGTGDVSFTNGAVYLYNNEVGLTWSGRTILGDGFRLYTAEANVLSANSVIEIGSGAVLELDYNQQIGGLTGVGRVQFLYPATLTVDFDDADIEFEGSIDGEGHLVKSGTGRLILSGETHTLGRTVQTLGGELVLNGNMALADHYIGTNGRLSGNGTVLTLAASEGQIGGVIAPGSATSIFDVDTDANFAGLTYEVAIEGEDAGLIRVNDTATLTGGQVSVLAGEGSYAEGASYQILEARTLIGEFASITDNLAFLNAELRYIGGDRSQAVDVVLTRNQVSFEDVAETGNQVAVARILTNMSAGDVLFDAALQLSDDEAAAAFDQLSGEIHASVQSVLTEEASRLRFAVADRLRRTSANAPAVTRGAFGAATTSTGVWALGFGSSSKIDGTENTAEVSLSSGGIMAGLDAALDSWTLGAFVGVSNADFDADDRNSSGSADAVHLGLYAGTSWDALGARFGVTYATSDVSTTRNVAFGDLFETISADYSGSAVQVFGELGYRLTSKSSTLEPFVNLSHIHLKTDGVTETGGSSALTVKGASRDTSFVTFGLHGASNFTLGGIDASARGTIGWQHVFGDPDSITSNRFVAGDAFEISGGSISKRSAIVEAGIDLTVSSTTTLSVSYGGDLGTESASHRGQIGLRMNF